MDVCNAGQQFKSYVFLLNWNHSTFASLFKWLTEEMKGVGTTLTDALETKLKELLTLG